MQKINFIITFISLSLIIGCSKKNNGPVNGAGIIDNDYAAFDSLFTQTDSAQYHTFSYENYNNFNGKIKLTAIPKRLYRYIDPGFDSSKENYDEYNAVYKFDYNKNIKGYIYTFTSEDSPSSVGLILYDKKTQTISGKTDLADSYGDEGWVYQKDAWLRDVNGDGYLDVLNRQVEWDFTEDTTFYADPNSNIVKDSVFAFTYSPANKEFVKIRYVNCNRNELVLKKFNE